jgi:hypothetical protein
MPSAIAISLSRYACTGAPLMHRILAPFSAEGMEAYTVSNRVNSKTVDDRLVIEHVKEL